MLEFKEKDNTHKEEVSRQKLLKIAEGLRGKELFPKKVERAKAFFKRAALTDKRFTTSSI